MTAPGGEDAILVLNAGSSSIKFAVFGGDLKERLTGMADGIGGDGALRVGRDRQTATFGTHAAALAAVLEGLAPAGAADGPIPATFTPAADGRGSAWEVRSERKPTRSAKSRSRCASAASAGTRSMLAGSSRASSACAAA